MSSIKTSEFAVQPPYLLFLADVTDIADSKTAQEASLPCCDPIRFGVGEIVDNLLRQ
jgi:hypothetical protein